MQRRAFLVTALTALPLGSCISMNYQSLARRRRAGIHVRAGHDQTGNPLHVFGGLRIDVKVPSGETMGDLFIIEHTDGKKGGPPKHLHHEQDEWFYVLAGRYLIQVGEEQFELGPGDSIFAPREVPHVWAHVSDGQGKLIIAFQPGGQMESFLAALADAGSAPSAEIMAPLFASHGMTLLGPPLPVE